MKKSINLYIKSILIVVITIALTIVIFSKLKFTSADYFKRTNTIIKVLKDDEIKKDVIFFGSSVCMSAVDGRQLGKFSKKKVLNLGSFEQYLPESACFYQFVNKSTAKVFQFVSVDDLMDNDSILSLKAQKRLIYYDYQITDAQKSLLDNYYLGLINANIIQRELSLRTSVFQNLRTKIRFILKSKSDSTKYIIENEIYSPNYYITDVDDDKLDLLIKKFTVRDQLDTFQLSERKLELLRKSNTYFKQNGIEYYVVINPIHPNILNYTNEFKLDLKDKLNALTDVEIIDLSNELKSEDFIDHVHLNKKGRDRLTEIFKTRI